MSFNGSKWNSMASHPNLLQSNSIPGGYRVSTQVGSPNSRGVTRNQSAQITLDGGSTTIGLNGDGQASIIRNGQSVPISAGQTLNLGNGTTVTCKQNGSLCVDSRNAMGGQISTTLSTKNGGGRRRRQRAERRPWRRAGSWRTGNAGTGAITNGPRHKASSCRLQCSHPPFQVTDPGAYAQPASSYDPITQYDTP